MERTQASSRQLESLTAVQTGLIDAMDQNFLQFQLNPNPQNLEALELTRRLLIEVNRLATLCIDEANDFVMGLLDELPPADYPVNPPPPGI